MILNVVMHRIGNPQHIIFGSDARAAALAVLHAAPEGAPAPHAVCHEYVWLVYQLQVTTFRLDKVQVPFYIAAYCTYNCTNTPGYLLKL